MILFTNGKTLCHRTRDTHYFDVGEVFDRDGIKLECGILLHNFKMDTLILQRYNNEIIKSCVNKGATGSDYLNLIQNRMSITC